MTSTIDIAENARSVALLGKSSESSRIVWRTQTAPANGCHYAYLVLDVLAGPRRPAGPWRSVSGDV